MIDYNAILFADVNFNLLDGSSVWLQSMANIVAKIYKGKVYLVLKHKVENDLLLSNVLMSDNVEVVDPSNTKYLSYEFSETLSPAGFSNICRNINKACGVRDLFIRGDRYSQAIVNFDEFGNSVTEYHASIPFLKQDHYFNSLKSRIKRLRFVAVQTESARSNLEMHIPESNGKVIVLSPSIPDSAFDLFDSKKDDFLIYSGKFDSNYNVEEYLDIPILKKGQKVLFIGNKFNKKGGDKLFIKRMKNSLIARREVEWVRGATRQEVLEIAAKARFGLCWRSSIYDFNEEVSTKMLEYMAVGTPPLLNKNYASVSLLGEDYPYYVESMGTLVNKLKSSPLDAKQYSNVRDVCFNIAKRFSYSNVANNLLRYYSGDSFISNKKILFAGHDFKFLNGVIRDFSENSSCSIDFDCWSSTAKHDVVETKKKINVADVVFVEWCVGAAVWYSNNKRKDQRLLVRLHRFEINTEWPSKLNISNVDHVVVVSQWFKDYCVENYKWPSSKISVIPQYIDYKYFDRPKLENSSYNLGFVGIVPYDHKRFDRALDILKAVRKKDKRFSLHVRSKMPWEFDYVWSNLEQRSKYEQTFIKLSDPLIKDSVVFDDPGSDMGTWFRKVNFVLSTSEYEGCHTAVAEGMGAGCYPIIFNWDGAKSVYGEEFVVDGIAEASKRIIDNVDHDRELIKSKAYCFDILNTIDFYRDFARG